ncbi:TPA: hypothetical protein ACP9DH_003142 [Legionella anisa]
MQPFEQALFKFIEKGDLLNTKKSLKLIIETEGESLDAVDENGNGFLLFALSGSN